jgi:hypothetical protein
VVIQGREWGMTSGRSKDHGLVLSKMYTKGCAQLFKSLKKEEKVLVWENSRCVINVGE